jgi:putative protease
METRIGKVTHYYNRIGVAVLELSGTIEIGDTILFLGHTTEFIQRVDSIEIEHRKILSAGPGQEIAVKVYGQVRRGDGVFRVMEVLDEGELPRLTMQAY